MNSPAEECGHSFSSPPLPKCILGGMVLGALEKVQLIISVHSISILWNAPEHIVYRLLVGFIPAPLVLRQFSLLF